MIAMLAPLAAHVTTVTPQNARSLDAEGTAREFRECGAEAEAYERLEDGVQAAVRWAKENGRPLVCLGSLYMYADVKQALAACLGE